MRVNKLSILIPCYNEAENLTHYPAEFFPVFNALGLPVEFIFIDDGSKDKTAIRLKELQSTRSTVKIVRHPENRGLGASIRSGLKAADGDAVLTMDADLTFAPADAETLLEAYSDDVDCVLGSPFLGGMAGVPAHRAFLSRMVNNIYRVLWARPITATSSIFRLYRASVLKSLELKSQSFNINAEILFRLLENGSRVEEVAVTLKGRRFGQSSIRFSREIFNHLLMFARVLRWRIFHGKKT